MASKGLQDLKQQVEGTAQEAGEDSARPRAQAGAPAWMRRQKQRVGAVRKFLDRQLGSEGSVLH